MDKPKCQRCGRPLRRFRWRDTEYGNGKEWGDYGDGFFCGLRCGYFFAVSALKFQAAKEARR